MSKARYVAHAGVIAAVYGAATILTGQLMGVLAWGPVQFRVSEALTVAALFTPAAIPGLTVGSVVANLYNLALGGSPLAILDVIFGSLGTLLGAAWTWRFRRRPAIALLGPVLSNALIVPAYLPLILKSLGLMGTYQIPLLGIDLQGSWVLMYLFGVVTVGIGQAVVMYALGLPLASALRRMRVSEVL